MYLFQPERFLLEQQIKKRASYITGSVLDVGGGHLRRYERFFKVTEYVSLDTEPHELVDVVGSADKIPLPNNRFDALISTQVLGDVFDFHAALEEFRRVLKPGGTILLTESFMNELHDEPRDYYRFTRFSFKKLFEAHGFSILHIDQRGGYFSVRAQLRLRYYIDRWSLYARSWANILRPFFSLYGRFSIARDKRDQSAANRKHALGWCVVARKK